MPKSGTVVTESTMVVLGKVVAPHGIAGWVKLRAFADDPHAWKRVDPLWGRPDRSGVFAGPDADTVWREFSIESLRLQGDTVLLKLMGLEDRTRAESLQGWIFGARREQLPKPAEGEYYWGDLVGLQVRNRNGVALGQVIGLIETGANDVLQVRGSDGREQLIPFVDAVVGTVDLDAGTIDVDWGVDW